MAPILDENAFDVITHSAKQTHAIGQHLGRLLAPGDVVCLQGDLGSGKTCLTQGIGVGLDVSGIISSPTFAFVNEHEPADAGPYLYHIDLYRINGIAEALSLGLEDYLYGDGVTVIEWAERARDLLPAAALWVKMKYLDYAKRSLIFEAAGDHYASILRSLRADLYGKPSLTSETKS